MTRDELSDKVINTANSHNGHLLLVITMGMGKTRTALKLLNQDNVHLKLILTHTVHSRDHTWPSEMEKTGIYPVPLEIHQFDAVPKLQGDYKIIVVDECHLITETLFKFLVRYINSARIIFMTGTLPDNSVKMQWLRFFKAQTIQYTFLQALEDGNINNIEFHIVYVDFDNTEKKYKVPFRAGVFTESEAYFQYCINVQNSTAKTKDMHINNRMWFIYKSETKTKAAIYIRNHLIATQKRNITFTTTKEIADKISENVHYSGCKNSKLDDFQSYKINDLVSINQMKVGANLEELRYMVAQQINSKMHDFMQMVNRTTRQGSDDVTSIVYVIVARDTMDVSWMVNATRNIPKSLVKEYHLSQEKLNTIKWRLD